MKKVKLKELLAFVEFEPVYRFTTERAYLSLEDCTGANWGDIDSERFEFSEYGVRGLLDRLDIYVQDYWFGWAEEQLEELEVSTSDMSQKEVYAAYKQYINPKGDAYIDAYFDVSLIDWESADNYE